MNDNNKDPFKPTISMQSEGITCLSKKSINLSTSKPESPSNFVSSSSQSDKSPNLFTITLQNLNDSSHLNQDSSDVNSLPFNGLVSSTTFMPKGLREERRRSNHNEVERRRRDNINKWIVELSKIIPECCNDQTKHGQVSCFIKNAK